MKLKPLKLRGLTLVVGLVLSACSASAVTESPSAAPTAQPPATPAVQQTTEPQALSTAAPTSAATAAPSVQPTPEPPPATGAMVWRDQVLRSDTAIFSINGLPTAPDGHVYAAWLASNEGSLPLGPISFSGGVANLLYISPTQDNLLGRYERVYVTDVPGSMATTTVTNVVLAGKLPDQALSHIRQILVTNDATPSRLGFALGLRQEADEVFRHAQFLRDAFNAGDLYLEKGHAEHLVNIIEGAQGLNFGDLRGDGKIQNPGDGFGLLPAGEQPGYIQGMMDQAQQALKSSDATDQVKLHAQHVQIAGENIRARLIDARDRALRINQASGIADTQQDVLNLVALAQQAIQGVDLNLDQQVSPIPGEGGTLTAYQHAQLMARIDLAQSQETEALVSVQAPQIPQLEKVIIKITDDVFVPNKVTIPVSATVVWKNEGQHPHTVTADKGAFDSKQIDPGGSFEHTFTKAGSFPFFCQFHGEQGGVGMAGTIIVADQSAAAAPAPAPATPAPAGSSIVVAPSSEVPVAINDSVFTPNRITIPAGTTEVWKHQGQQAHTVTADDSSFKSGEMTNAATFKQTFDKPGSYLYYCEIHGDSGGEGMAGVIVVIEQPKP
jgi:plastocyanin